MPVQGGAISASGLEFGVRFASDVAGGGNDANGFGGLPAALRNILFRATFAGKPATVAAIARQRRRQVPVWNLGDGIYLLNDEQVDYSMPLMTASMASGRMMMADDGFPLPSGFTNIATPSFDLVAPDYGTNLWIAQWESASGYLTGILSNSEADIQYEMQSMTDLAQTGLAFGEVVCVWFGTDELDAVQRVGRQSRPIYFCAFGLGRMTGAGCPCGGNSSISEPMALTLTGIRRATAGTICRNFRTG